MAAVSLFWDTNMAAVTSRETLYISVILINTFYFCIKGFVESGGAGFIS